MIAVPATADNRALASAVNARIQAEALMLAARAAVWCLSGLGVLLLLAGAGTGAAFYGYSYVRDSRASLNQMAAAFATALDHANLGHAKLDVPDCVLKLDPNPAMRVDPPAHTAMTDPATPGPSERHWAGELPTLAVARPVTHYTIFKTVAFGDGQVQTGWAFETNGQDHPASQFCNYRPDLENETVSSSFILIAKDGHLVRNDLDSQFGLDAHVVAASCVWFDGRATVL